MLSSADVRRPGTVAVLKSTLQDADETVRLSGAAALLLADDVTALGVAEQELLRPNPNLAQYAIGLRFGIAQGLSTPVAIPTLVRLLQEGDDETKRAACSALGRTHSPLAIRPLVTALDDPNIDVQYSAVVGLSNASGLTNRRPSRPAFAMNPERYVEFWKDWAKNR